MKPFALTLGTILVTVGVFMGIGNQSVIVGHTSIGCGSVFTHSQGRDAESKDEFNYPAGTPSRYGEKCASKLASMQMLVTILIVVGGAVGVAGVFIPLERRPIEGVHDGDTQAQADTHWQAAQDNRLLSAEDRAQAEDP
jgi:hypothetical protein